MLPNTGLITVRLILGQASATAVSDGAGAGNPIPTGVDGIATDQLPGTAPTTDLIPGSTSADGVQLADRTAPPAPDFDKFSIVLVIGGIAAIATARIRLPAASSDTPSAGPPTTPIVQPNTGPGRDSGVQLHYRESRCRRA
ncbi:hypothetical protein [Sporichthya sp.]|uniref:hypothetical protein n=1 Tax=Sporichthya sp. TaxID=65475 RepID=UPI001858E43E|nr:hypothetical protein [Sporichthya sp.]MBA3742885.1 hypothetical protein [Sporichthya sp.]